MIKRGEEDAPTQLIPPEFQDEGLTQPVPPASSLSSTQGMSQAATQIVPQAMRSQQHRRQPSFADVVRTPEVKKPVPSAHVEKTKSTGADAGKSLPSRKPKRRGRRNQGADVPQRPIYGLILRPADTLVPPQWFCRMEKNAYKVEAEAVNAKGNQLLRPRRQPLSRTAIRPHRRFGQASGARY